MPLHLVQKQLKVCFSMNQIVKEWRKKNTGKTENYFPLWFLHNTLKSILKISKNCFPEFLIQGAKNISLWKK